LDVGSGKADFSIGDLDKSKFNPQFQTVLHGPGKYNLMFANCDRQLYLWINGSVVQVAEYPDLHNDMPQPADLLPVGVASAGVKMKLSHLNIFRDIYYIATNRQEELNDYIRMPPQLLSGNFEDFFSDPGQWKYLDRSNMRSVQFPLDENEFFAMGDNSAKSADSRIWGTIPRDLLIGKAFFVYWPHSWHRVPGTSIPFPFFPNFSRMGFVR
jgi:signal peptidase I